MNSTLTYLNLNNTESGLLHLKFVQGVGWGGSRGPLISSIFSENGLDFQEYVSTALGHPAQKLYAWGIQ